MASKIFGCAIVAVICGLNLIVQGVPVGTDTKTEIYNTSEASNGTHQELYIVKVSTYEVGILAEVPNNQTESDDDDDEYDTVHQQVDLSFYDTESNGSYINLGDIPFPVQTNVSGQIVTGVAPVHIGAVKSIGEALKALPFSGTIVNITNSDTSYLTVNRDNISQFEQSTILKNNDDLAKLPILNNVLLPDSFHEAIDDVHDADKEEQ